MVQPGEMVPLDAGQENAQEGPIKSLHQAVTLWVVGCGGGLLNIQDFADLLDKFRLKMPPLVGNAVVQALRTGGMDWQAIGRSRGDSTSHVWGRTSTGREMLPTRSCCGE